MTDLTSVLQLAASLSIDDRIRLVQEVWDGLVESGVEPALSEEAGHELDRRLSELREHPETAVTWDEIEAHVRRPG